MAFRRPAGERRRELLPPRRLQSREPAAALLGEATFGAGEGGDHRGDDEEMRQRGGERLGEGGARCRRQVREGGTAEPQPAAQATEPGGGEAVGQPRAEERAERRRPHRAADRAEEGGARGG